MSGEKLRKTPKEFLKSRRPERFSDSTVEEKGSLDRAILEHHLSTLGQRSQELAFENFAKKLCEKTICPNLLEQTGPVAGGDGKTDTQTFPVTEQLKGLWYVGVNESANEERWAFAISTQEDWKAKCRKDARKIAKTDRGYKRIICITSRYAKANQRSDIEDELTKELNIDVRILDINWILDRIYQNQLERLAIDELSIETTWERVVEVGPGDYSKERKYKELEARIRSEVDASNIEYFQLDWFISTAELSAELEYSELDTRGLFDRAVLLAEKFGNDYHRFKFNYSYAWYLYWWFGDYKCFAEKLTLCIKFAKSIQQSTIWGDVTTLIMLLTSANRAGVEFDLDIDAVKADVIDGLNNIAAKVYMPSNASTAKIFIKLLELLEINSREESSQIFLEIFEILKFAEGLVGFQFERFNGVLSELDPAFFDIPEYEKIQDYLVEQEI